MCLIKENGSILLLSDIVSVGVYKFEEYEILEIGEDRNGLHENRFIVGHAKGEKPFAEENGMTRAIEPTETDTVSDRQVFDSLLILASNALVALQKDSDKLILLWCKKYGLPFCSDEASKQIGYLACPLHQFRNYFLFSLRDTFWKVESMCEVFSVEHDIDTNLFNGPLVKNPYKKRVNHFTKERKESLISEFINEANLRTCFEYRNGVPVFYNYAPDIISLARYQFALILLSNSDSTPRHCKCCGSMFFAHRKNQLYGPCCTRQKRYAAEKRRKAREEGLRKHG